MLVVFCVAIFSGQLWFITVMLILCVVFAVLENRYERGLMGGNARR